MPMSPPIIDARASLCHDAGDMFYAVVLLYYAMRAMLADAAF